MLRARFDFAPAHGDGPTVYADPVRVVRAEALDQVVPALETVQRLTRDGLHAAGFVAYEAAPAFDPAMVTFPGPTGDDALPLLCFGLFERPADPADQPAPTRPTGHPADADPTGWTLETTPEAHARAVGRIHEAIAEGRTYQVNLTTRLRAAFHGDPEALYHRLRRAQGGGYHALLDLGRHAILSASPELFFHVRGREITARPMKGTRPRGRWPDEDRALAHALADSPKERAENLMIVDLLRNDLGRVCVPGGVRVPALWDVERYRTVWQLTSTITGTLLDDVGLVDLFRALFPCGSVTGAPKISTMGIIAGLERSPRGVYCGAIGWVRPGGDCTFNVPIRTAWVDRDAGRITYGTGGGVVWDSTPEAEYHELLAKATVAREPWPPFRLLETLGLHHGRPVRLDRHLRRMAASAERFDFPFPEAAIRQKIADIADRHPHGHALLRITLGPRADIEADVRAMDRVGSDGPDGGDPAAVVIAAEPVDPGHPFLYHKTTHRAVYDRHAAAAPADAFDTLLWNPDGHATEFCRGNLVAEIDGRLLTPPREAGLLPGCLRDQLIDQGRITEAPIPLDDLHRASRLWFVNSARGWVPVRIERPG